MSHPFDRAAAAAFLAARWGSREGRAVLAFGRDGGWNERDRYAHRDWDEVSYAWPAERERLLGDVERELSAGPTDVYFCVELRADDHKRRKGGAIPPAALHVDADGPLDDEAAQLWERLAPMRVMSGTAGREHGYVLLDRPCDLGTWNRLSAALNARLGAGADAKFADNDLLRLPGTQNFKHDPPVAVELSSAAGRTWSVAELTELLGLDAPQGVRKLSAPLTLPSVEPVPEPLPSAVVRAINTPSSGDRSADAARVIEACAFAGLAEGQALSVLRDHPSAAHYRDGRHAAQDVARLYGKFAPAATRAAAGTVQGGAPGDSPGEQVPTRRLKVTRASEIVPRPVRWLWDRRVVLGGLTLLAGREGLGKSTAAVWLAAQVTRGRLDGEFRGEPRSVVYVNSEDARDYTIRPRLEAAGADLDRVLFVDAVMPGAEPGQEHTDMIVLPRDAELLAGLARDEGAALVVLDAATSVIDARLDGNQDRQMRIGLEAIARAVAEGSGAAVLGVVHFGKRDSSDTGKLILGSIAWSQVARSVLAVAQNEEDGSLVLTRSKGNLGVEPPSLAMRIVSAAVSTPEGDTSVGRVELLGETDQDARQLLGVIELDPEERTERDAAAAWLGDYLTQYMRPPSKDVKRAARDAGFTERTLARARNALSNSQDLWMKIF